MEMNERKKFEKEKSDFERLVNVMYNDLESFRKKVVAEKEKLYFENEAYLKEKKEMENRQYLKQACDDIIEINVGGTILTTLKSTLTKNTNSSLAIIFSGRHTLACDEEGRIFLDRNPRIFMMVLDYLRTSHIPQKFRNGDDELEFNNEMDYFLLGTTEKFIPVWDAEHKSNGLHISEDGKTIEVVGEDGDHVVLIGKNISSNRSANGGKKNNRITKGVVSVTIQVTIPRPNRYSIGVLPSIPNSFNRGFGYKQGMMGWGLHDHMGSLGIFCQTQLVAQSSMGYATNDLVTMIVDVDRGNLVYKVNGVKCAEMLGCDAIRMGVYMGVTLFNKSSVWRILD